MYTLKNASEKIFAEHVCVANKQSDIIASFILAINIFLIVRPWEFDLNRIVLWIGNKHAAHTFFMWENKQKKISYAFQKINETEIGKWICRWWKFFTMKRFKTSLKKLLLSNNIFVWQHGIEHIQNQSKWLLFKEEIVMPFMNCLITNRVASHSA